jgi:hypothetical protein
MTVSHQDEEFELLPRECMLLLAVLNAQACQTSPEPLAGHASLQVCPHQQAAQPAARRMK